MEDPKNFKTPINILLRTIANMSTYPLGEQLINKQRKFRFSKITIIGILLILIGLININT